MQITSWSSIEFIFSFVGKLPSNFFRHNSRTFSSQLKRIFRCSLASRTWLKSTRRLRLHRFDKRRAFRRNFPFSTNSTIGIRGETQRTIPRCAERKVAVSPCRHAATKRDESLRWRGIWKYYAAPREVHDSTESSVVRRERAAFEKERTKERKEQLKGKRERQTDRHTGRKEPRQRTKTGEIPKKRKVS